MSRILMKSEDKYKSAVALLYILGVALLTWIRPIHQDDGWYASFAFNLINQFYRDQIFSSWNYDIAGFSSAKTGFSYGIYQLPFILIFGSSLLYLKVLVFITTILALFFIVRFLSVYFQKSAIYFPLLLLAWPGFWYHFYNRPEMLAVAIGFLGMWILADQKKSSKYWVALSYSIPFLMFDIHPISVFLVFGYYFWFIFKNRTMLMSALFGCALGSIIYLSGNWVIHGSLGIASPLLGMTISRGDHYIPAIESGIIDIFNIAYIRYKPFIIILGASLLWVPPLIYPKRLKYIFINDKTPLSFILICFLVLTSLFSEATSNGFQLYSSIVFFILIWLLGSFAIEQLDAYGSRRFIVLTPLMAIFLYVNISQFNQYQRFFKYALTFHDKYARTLGDCVSHGSNGLMRPTFSVALAGHRGHFEYTFNILFYMKNNNISFGRAILEKGFDYVAIDDMDKRDLFQIRNVWNNYNWYYNVIENTVASNTEFNMLVEKGALIPACVFDEISHGKTTFYRVHKDILKSTLNNN
jgi:hypothetical protein